MQIRNNHHIPAGGGSNGVGFSRKTLQQLISKNDHHTNIEKSAAILIFFIPITWISVPRFISRARIKNQLMVWVIQLTIINYVSWLYLIEKTK